MGIYVKKIEAYRLGDGEQPQWLKDEQVPKMIDQAELDALLMAEAEEEKKRKKWKK